MRLKKKRTMTLLRAHDFIRKRWQATKRSAFLRDRWRARPIVRSIVLRLDASFYSTKAQKSAGHICTTPNVYLTPSKSNFFRFHCISLLENFFKERNNDPNYHSFTADRLTGFCHRIAHRIRTVGSPGDFSRRMPVSGFLLL